ncbi:hypothetical protein, partial [Spongiactinospora gelatinilytica]|uniref:hypothetical protein n=1 Tax=Spongiactinospora gelatinilytica TaxID=2666298 RepID=UPI001F483D80
PQCPDPHPDQKEDPETALDTPVMLRVVQGGFGVFLLIWVGIRALRLARRTRATARHRRTA